MTRFVLRDLCTDGLAIVSADTDERILRETEPYVQLSEMSTWGEFRAADLPAAIIDEVVESALGSVDEYIQAVERAHGITESGSDLTARWAAVSDLPFAGDDEYPADQDEFSWSWGYGDPELEIDMLYRAAMLDDLPDEILDRFELIEDTTLDGYLGRAQSDDIDAIVAALEELGHTVG